MTDVDVGSGGLFGDEGGEERSEINSESHLGRVWNWLVIVVGGPPAILGVRSGIKTGIRALGKRTQPGVERDPLARAKRCVGLSLLLKTAPAPWIFWSRRDFEADCPGDLTVEFHMQGRPRSEPFFG